MHQISWSQHNSLSKFRFRTPLFKLSLWVCIFNLTLFLLGILQYIIGAPLYFISLHFMKNNRCCLRHYVVCKSFFYPWIFLLCLKNSSKCFKSLIYSICTQIISNGNAIFHLIMYYNLTNYLLKLLVTILFSISHILIETWTNFCIITKFLTFSYFA